MSERAGGRFAEFDRLPSIFGRPRLTIALLVWAGAFILLRLVWPALGWRTSGLVAWDFAVIVFLALRSR